MPLFRALYIPSKEEFDYQILNKSDDIKTIWNTDIKNLTFPCYIITEREYENNKLKQLILTEVEHWKVLNGCDKPETKLYDKPEDLQYSTVRVLDETTYEEIKNIGFYDAYIWGCIYNEDNSFKCWQDSFSNWIYPNQITKIVRKL
jgi:hypothetical protein